ncbi:MAG: DNA-binding transcriptional regulator OxyR [Gammaproteobacteria bacterium]|jgi:LysR family hydrogen peroxide-inducible transcriptional activator|nr:DNA-binding transcriptional regulator OxyR [Gammaproteobacteria bacterium]
MNLRDLEYVVALDEEQHFHRAAERCCVSQPTLSGQVRKLEDTLGVQLVERNGRQVRMTEAGREVAAQARRVLAEARAIKELAAAFRDPLQGRLQVGVIPTIAPYLLPLFMARLRARHPHLQLFLHEQQTAVLLERLHRGELDLLILALPVETQEFAEQNLYDEPFLLAVPANHPLAARKKVTLDHLHGQDVLLLEEGHCLRGQALDVCMLAGASEFRGFRGTSLETVRQMVAEGIGITLMPQLAAGEEAGIRYLPFAEPAPTRRVGLLYRKGSYRQAAFAAIAKVIREAAGEAMGRKRVVVEPPAARRGAGKV